MLLEMAMADAYAAAWEFVEPEKSPINDWSGYKARPGSARASRYTDDTMRTIANARVILKGEVAQPQSYVRELKRVFRSDKRGGWSRSFRAFLESQMDLPDVRWMRDLKPRNTNGALMGAAVMGVMPAPDLAFLGAQIQAKVTHDDDAALFAGIIGLTSYLVRRGATPENLMAQLNKSARFSDGETLMDVLPVGKDMITPVDMTSEQTCAHVIDILCTQNTFRGIVNETIRRGGDTDSVAAAAVGIASLNRYSYQNDFPEWMNTDLEGGDTMSQGLLRSLDEKLTDFMRQG